ncbi:MAG: MiaB/RimO family radical SAM methylthiotransferase [Spirochaetia bacterium]|nr:MiaB/RimO family radical SAM methylthiotransferase [Spirochaetia bacterium]
MKSQDVSFYIETLGCPKNIVDSRTMRGNLLINGFVEAKTPENADLILINTCSFIKEAQETTIDTIFEAVRLKASNKNKKIGIVGCFSEQFAGSLENQIPEADFFLGTRRYHEIAHVVSQKCSIELMPRLPGEKIHSRSRNEIINPYAYFRIAQGCSRKCAFCVIPAIRGSFEPYTIDHLKQQYEQEMSQRYETSNLREAIFVSQDTISTPEKDLRQFIEFFESLGHISWIRLHYLFPDKRIFDIIRMMSEYPKIVPYLDIPFQHISRSVLEAMNRPGDAGLFSEIIGHSLLSNPEMEIRTAFIIGFPGETDEDIEEAVRFIENNPVHKLALFRYSHEEGTPAFQKSRDLIPDKVKAERMNYVREAHIKARTALRSNLTGKKTLLMLDEVNPDEIIARRPQDSPDIDEVVYLSTTPELDLKVGDMVEARLNTAMEYDWIGEIIAKC